MKTKEIGIMVFLIGTLFLSIQIYLLKIVQKLDEISGSSFVNELRYIEEPSISISFSRTIFILILSLFFIFKDQKNE